MTDGTTDINELSNKVLIGVQRALYKLVKISAANNKNLVIGDKHGNIKSVPAKKLLKTLPKSAS